MPLPPKQREKKKKVVAVSASKANDPLAGKRKTTKAEFAAIQAENSKAEREKKAAARAKLEEKAKAAEVARIKALTAQATQVEELTSQDGPKVISNCVARTLGLPPNQLPKQVLEQAVQLMPDVDLLPGLPKAQLLQLAAVLVERRAVKRAADFETLQQERAAQERVLESARMEAEARAREKAARAARAATLAEQRVAEKLASMELREPREDETGEGSGSRGAGKAPGQQLTKEQVKAQKAKAKLAKDVAEETAAVNAELASAVRVAAALRLDGIPPLTAIDCGPFNLPNPGGGANLLEDASFVLAPGHRYAVIGRNGKGKSTLLRWLAARRVGGLPERLHVHYVSQEVTLTAEQEESLPVHVIIEADVERSMLLEEVAKAEATPEAADPDRLVTVHERLEAISADTAEARADQLLVNLGFSEELRLRPMSRLSGGWRVRVALAAALFAAPDLLLLDEPTNHLSIDAVLWLQHELSTNPIWEEKIVAIVSHDRAFLDDACTDVLHISGHAKRLTQQRGSYTTWAKRRAEQQATWARKSKDRADQRAKMYERANCGFRFGGSDMNKQQQLLKQIERSDLEKEREDDELAALNEDEELPLKLCAGGQLNKPAVMIKGVRFNYPGGKTLFSDVEMRIEATRQSRIVLMGENGNGKTTLVNILMGKLDPVSGLVERESGARIEVVNQHHADQIDLSLTPLAFLKSKFPGDGSNAHDLKLRSHLAGCGVSAELMMRPGTALSGGQRSRVALAAVSFARPHVLVMDEPTNNLDLEAVAALAECVENFDGGVLLVSHDQYFVGRVAKEVWVVEGGAVNRVESFASYTKGIKARIKRGAGPH